MARKTRQSLSTAPPSDRSRHVRWNNPHARSGAFRRRWYLTTPPAGGTIERVAEKIRRSFWRIALIALVNLVLIALIVGLTLANWMPAIYRSEWYQSRFGT